jgi:hypothetical protein
MKCSVYRSSIRRCAIVALMLVMAIVFMTWINGVFVSSAKAESVLDIVTEEYKQETLDMILDLDSPLPVERIKNIIEADEIRKFGPYEEKLREEGAIDESRIWFGAREWYVYDSSMVVRKYITLDRIKDYALGGEANDVFCDDNGNPLFRKLNMNEKASKACDNGIKLIRDAGVTNIYEAIRDSGMCVCAINVTPLGGASLVDDCGAVYPYMGEVELGLPDKNLSYLFAKIFIDEPTYVRYFQTMEALGFDSTMGMFEFVDNGEVVKSNMGYDLVSLLDGKLFTTLVGTFSAEARNYAQKLGVSVDDPMIKRQEDVLYETSEILGEDLIRKNK